MEVLVGNFIPLLYDFEILIVVSAIEADKNVEEEGKVDYVVDDGPLEVIRLVEGDPQRSRYAREEQRHRHEYVPDALEFVFRVNQVSLSVVSAVSNLLLVSVPLNGLFFGLARPHLRTDRCHKREDKMAQFAPKYALICSLLLLIIETAH